MSRSLKEFCEEADRCVQAIASEITHLGQLILSAEKELHDPDDRQKFKDHLLCVIRETDYEAAKKVAKGEFDSRLFFLGAASSKIILV